ncbi:HigA family addiction module antitoxin [Amycolatopsis thermoflava]|uniref:HTH-type transcriptional regulator/antitoxin HigA n=1 Tax=Amycolatopsis thermoflava TaxID=84480 RepID=A0A3N2GPD8_9PSEU|nr:HigA family addiction module antitoxin [Amycolatopsis thermoflava]ROS38496.1 HTH-type transcriptional regulator/antitoxin HigA [Amycolatopsis thermoflava]
MNAGPAEAFPVGEHLMEELDARGWTQAEFAEILGRPPQAISEIVSGRKEITRDSAAQIAAALGTSPQYWLNLQDQFHLWKQTQDAGIRKQLNDVRLRARLNELAPLAVLRKRGVITATTPQEQAEQLCQLLEIESIDQEPRLPMAARRSNVAERVSAVQVAWLACVRRQAEQRPVSAYSADALRALAERLSNLVRDPAAFARFPALFADAGVRLVHVEAFPSSKIDGASFDMDGTPVIGLSGRGQRLDKVLFTLLHEVAHVVLNHIADGLILDEGEEDGQDREQEADCLARDWALPGRLPAVPDRISQGWLTRVATSLGVHPIVVVGRLQNDGVLNWRTLLAKNAPTVTAFLRTW